MLPVELSHHHQGQQAEWVLQVNADLFWFQGHFPGQPLLPGVAQLDWVLHYAALLAPGKRFSSIENIKFQRPVLPGSRLKLALEWQAEKSLLRFCYSLLDTVEPVAASSGKIRLC
ncbi:hydroxymyristoyl-ACP dehydratase [Paramixta manurensis]|uniref:Hydroxymyristoyl-ACP dehydratase n=1 Tax=Paramixta manurensis TaxID=2740817 RepID=A0A6M8UB04_9GAMM|nr:hydroxymyristoyl-ACP dehydratase [Erwiniaceae bacterium PD-1]